MARITNPIRLGYILCTVIFGSIAAGVQAQTQTMDSISAAGLQEITNIQLATAAYDNQQFDISIISTDGSATDTTTGTFSIQGENYRSTFDSVEQVQNSFLNLEIHTDGKILVASRPVSFSKQFFKGNVDEAAFQRMNVNSISVVNAGSNKKLSFNFLPESDFVQYDVTYDPVSYRVSDVFIKVKTVDSTGNYSSSVFAITSISLRNFQTITAGSVSFDTSQYLFVSDGNVLNPQPAYNDYQIINLLDENNNQQSQ
jgi:hypothetical protein